MPKLRVILALGGISHLMTLKALGVKPAGYVFGHGAMHTPRAGLLLADSYHVSRYNTSTKRLNAAMFEKVVGDIRGYLRG